MPYVRWLRDEQEMRRGLRATATLLSPLVEAEVESVASVDTGRSALTSREAVK